MEPKLDVGLDVPLLEVPSWQWMPDTISLVNRSPEIVSLETSTSETQESVESHTSASAVEKLPQSRESAIPITSSVPFNNANLEARRKTSLENVKRIWKAQREQTARIGKQQTSNKAALIELSKSEESSNSHSESPSKPKLRLSEKQRTCNKRNITAGDLPEEELEGEANSKISSKIPVRKVGKGSTMHLMKNNPWNSASGRLQRDLAIPKMPQGTHSIHDQSNRKGRAGASLSLPNMGIDTDHLTIKCKSAGILPQYDQEKFMESNPVVSVVPISTRDATSSQPILTCSSLDCSASGPDSHNSVIEIENTRVVTSKRNTQGVTVCAHDISVRCTRSRDESLGSSKDETKPKKLKIDHQLAGSGVIASSTSNPQVQKSPQRHPRLIESLREPQNLAMSFASPPNEILDHIPFIQYFEKQYKDSLALKGGRVIDLEEKLAVMRNVESVHESHFSTERATACREISELQKRIAELNKDKANARNEIEILKNELTAEKKANSSIETALEIWSLKTQVINLNVQMTKQTHLINEFVTEWKRVSTTCEDQKTDWHKKMGLTTKLTEELKELSNALKKEKLLGKRVEYEKLNETVREILTMPEIAPMASMAFGRVGQAFMKLQEVIKDLDRRLKVEVEQDEDI